MNSMSLDGGNQHVTIGGGVITDDFVRFLESREMEVSKCNVEAFYTVG